MKIANNIERGLFRIYIILALCGFICLGISLWRTYDYKVRHDWKREYYSRNREYMNWLAHYTDSTNHPYAYACRWSGDAYREYLLEKHGGVDRDGYHVDPRNEPVDNISYINKALEGRYEIGYQNYYRPMQKYKGKAWFWAYFFLGLSIAPCGFHFLAKFTLVPMLRWIIKGFKP